MKKKTLAASIMTIAMCGSLVAGATFALFTHESETNVAITSGKVEVVATLENLELYSPTLIAADGSEILNADNAAADGTFGNGGTAVLASPEITLSNMTPGDYATFQIKITNYSTVAAQYRTVLKVVDDNGLLSGLEMGLKAGSEENYASYEGNVVYSNWETLSIPAGGSEVVELNDCKIELPIGAGNEYEEKSCKFVCVVEAIQANAETNNYVAKIGETTYDSFEKAVAEVKEGETIEITRPGTYAPFTITKNNVTVKGIVGATKAESTIIKTTATQNIKAHADNVTLDSLYVDATTPITLSPATQYGGAINGFIKPDGNTNSAKLTVQNCTIIGEGTNNAIAYHGAELVFDHNKVENVDRLNMFDNHRLTAATHAYTNNTIGNVGYEMIVMNAYQGTSFTFTGNMINDDTMISVNDCKEDGTAYTNVVINGNVSTKETIYRLGWFGRAVNTPHTVTAGENERVVYFGFVKFNANGSDYSDYKIVTADGRQFTPDLGLVGSSTAVAETVLLETGDYKLVEIETENVVAEFTVNVPNANAIQVVQMPEVSTVATAAELLLALQSATNDGTTTTISITSDINVNGEWTAFALPYASDAVVINGNGHTITGLTQPLLVGTAAGSSNITINGLTISGATINDTGYNGLGLGAFIAYADAVKYITFNECHLLDSTVKCTDGYAGGLIGYFSASGDGSAYRLTINNCSVKATTISGYKSVGGLVGHLGAGKMVVSNSSVENNTISEIMPDRTSAGAAAIVGRISGASCSAAGTITVKGNTINQGTAYAGGAVNLLTALGEVALEEGASLVTE